MKDEQKKNNINKKPIRTPIINENNLLNIISLLASSVDLDRKQIEIISEFMKNIDQEFYSQDLNISAMIYTIELLCSDRMSGYDNCGEIVLNQLESSMNSLYNDVKENLIIPAIMNSDNISLKNSVSLINSFELILKYNKVLNYKETLSDVMSNLTSYDSLNLESNIKNFEKTIKDINEEFNKIMLNNSNMLISNTNSNTFSLNQLFDTYKIETSPIHIFKTGLKRLNQMLSKDGGLISNKYYMFYANINNFKSTLLLYLAKWISQYNGQIFKSNNYILSGKKPTVLFVSLENPSEEDFSKLFTMYTGKSLKSMRSFEEAKRLWDLKLEEIDSPISITMVHPPIESFTISELKRIMNNLREDNYEIIAVIIDYIECIRPEIEDRKMDIRNLMTKHSELLHYIASREKVCVISAMQINRVGSGLLNELKNKKVTDHVTRLGREHIGESYGIDKKTDWSAFINIESMIKDYTKKFFTIKREKCRYERTDVEYFVHPLNGIILPEDANLPGDETYSQSAVTAEFEDGLEFYKSNKEENIAVGDRGAVSIREFEIEDDIEDIKYDESDYTYIPSESIGNYYTISSKDGVEMLDDFF